MEMTWNAGILRQFGAAIDMLENAVRLCPEELWQGRLYEERAVEPEYAEFWYIAFHALFWLDFYLTDAAEGFAPPAPFTLAELEAGEFPERMYSKTELLTYLEYGRSKCRARLESAADLLAPQRCRPDFPDVSVAELMLYNMRHIQEHAAQLSLFLGQKVGTAPGWVSGMRRKSGSA